MADDSIEIIEPLDFHPCNSPRGMMYYDLQDLTEEQQVELNKFKINTVRENEKYLAAHPQIRACIALVSRHVFQHQPRTNIPEFIGEFFHRPRGDIEKEVEDYIAMREPHNYEGDSAVNLNKEYLKEPSVVAFEEEEEIDVPRALLDEIIEKAMTRLEASGWRTYPTDEKAEIIKSIISEIVERAINEREKMLMYLLQSGGDDENKNMEYVDDIIPNLTPVLTSWSSSADTAVKNVTEIEVSKPDFDEDISEITNLAVGSEEVLEISQITELSDAVAEHHQDGTKELQSDAEPLSEISEPTQENVQHSQENTEQPQELTQENVEPPPETPAVETPPNKETPEEAT